ncbi:hypothetical protein BKA61DRAFT_654855 [Leptodontidium sp. MPI-SDFR-AT-0119]|nr:hypothetical protein BKA61DRAFT_654855 [Leptodontidium sp. MPI-SDFR-AT-0119]
MPNTLSLLRRNITLDEALRDDDNLLPQIQYPRQRQEFFDYLFAHKAEIESIVSFHLSTKHCRAGDVQTWLSGSFNVCIPVYIDPPSEVRSVFVRIPLPYKVGEAKSVGNAEEKLRCEVASYLWMQENCPDVSIPIIWVWISEWPDEHTSLFSRLAWSARRILLSWLGFPTPCRYISRTRRYDLNTGYMIIGRVTRGKMLSSTWNAFRHDKTRRTNLFHNLARIMLSLNKSPLPAIGSLTLNHQGCITLTNRPLTLQLHSLENEGVPTFIRSTYSTVEPYLLDLLSCHDNRISYQPNSIHDKDDGQQQLAALTMMRAVLHHFIQRDYRNGPFVFTLTDLHQSNIFVDDDWNIISLIDLEWACSLPIQLQCPPYWLSGRGIDQMEHGEPLETFRQLVFEYFEAFEYEERAMNGDHLYQTPIMRECWTKGSFWYFHAINSPKGLFRVCNEHIQRLFCPEHCDMKIFDQVVVPYWKTDAAYVIEERIKEEERYKDQLRAAFDVEIATMKEKHV